MSTTRRRSVEPPLRIPASGRPGMVVRSKGVKGRGAWLLCFFAVPLLFLFLQGTVLLEAIGVAGLHGSRWALVQKLGAGQDELLQVEKYFRKFDSPTKQDQHDPFATCRIAPACVLLHNHELELVLPSHVTEAESQLLAGCSGSEIAIYRKPIETLSLSIRTEAFQPYDLLVGFLPFIPSSHIFPNFLMGAGPLLDMAEVTLGNRSDGGEQYLYHKFAFSGTRWTQMASPEPPAHQRRGDLAPAVVVSRKTIEVGDMEGARSGWINRFLVDLFAFAHKDPRLLSPPNTPTPDVQCFRSVWLPPQPLHTGKSLQLTRQTFFSSNGRVKQARSDFCSSSTLAVKILNQKGVGAISNVPVVLRAVRNALGDRYKNISLEEVFLEGKRYEKQVNVMQKTDILIAAHSTGIANAIFMKDRTFLLEILPFGYLFSDFQKALESIFEIEGSFVFSEPGSTTFAAILHDFCSSGSNAGAFIESCYLEVKRLQDSFANLSELVNTSTLGNNIENLRNFPDASQLMQHPGGNKALRGQTLKPNPVFIEERLRSWIRARCPK